MGDLPIAASLKKRRVAEAVILSSDMLTHGSKQVGRPTSRFVTLPQTIPSPCLKSLLLEPDAHFCLAPLHPKPQVSWRGASATMKRAQTVLLSCLNGFLPADTFAKLVSENAASVRHNFGNMCTACSLSQPPRNLLYRFLYDRAAHAGKLFRASSRCLDPQVALHWCAQSA